ncbi:MAG TPA: hypothetical protein VKX30_03875 [Flavobacteriaceae bacterium]|nr:hypothetical protein [Flavobacteriaceae bacterium]
MYYAISGGVQTGNSGVCLLDEGNGKPCTACAAKSLISLVKTVVNAEIEVAMEQWHESIPHVSMLELFSSQQGISSELFLSDSTQHSISLILL